MNKISQLNYLSLFYFLLRSSFFPLLLPLLLPLENISLLSMILAILFGYFLLTIFFTVQNRFADKNILDAMEDGFGKKIGFFINSFLCFVVFLLMLIQMLHLTNFIYTEYLNETSFFVLVLLFFLSTFYVAHKGLESLCKSCFLFFILSIFLFLVKCFGVISEVDPMYLLPFKITHPFLKETFSFCTFYILPLFLILLIPKNNIKRNHVLSSNMKLTYLFTSLMLFLNLFFILTVLSPSLASTYSFPEFHLLKSVKILGFIEKIESFLSIAPIFDMFVFLVLGFLYIKTYVRKYFKPWVFYGICLFFLFLTLAYSFENISILLMISTVLFVISYLIFFLLSVKKKNNPTS